MGNNWREESAYYDAKYWRSRPLITLALSVFLVVFLWCTATIRNNCTKMLVGCLSPIQKITCKNKKNITRNRSVLLIIGDNGMQGQFIRHMAESIGYSVLTRPENYDMKPAEELEIPVLKDGKLSIGKKKDQKLKMPGSLFFLFVYILIWISIPMSLFFLFRRDGRYLINEYRDIEQKTDVKRPLDVLVRRSLAEFMCFLLATFLWGII